MSRPISGSFDEGHLSSDVSSHGDKNKSDRSASQKKTHLKVLYLDSEGMVAPSVSPYPTMIRPLLLAAIGSIVGASFGVVVLASGDIALKLHFHGRGKLSSTLGNKCTIEERNAFLGAVRVAIQETYIPSSHYDRQEAPTTTATGSGSTEAEGVPPWWCYGLCQQHDEGEYCAVVHPGCSLQAVTDAAVVTAAHGRRLHENRLLPVRELSRQAHPSELRKDRSTADQKTICRTTRVSFLSRVHDLMIMMQTAQQQQQQQGVGRSGSTGISDACLYFLKHRFDLECFVVPPPGTEETTMFQLSSFNNKKPATTGQELRGSAYTSS
jgi:hypothetical protein